MARSHSIFQARSCSPEWFQVRRFREFSRTACPTTSRALTGIDTDRLPEEKRRGITIDLGFASLDTQAPDGTTLRLSFVDVPGHARFVRNMLAGAGGIDAVLMVIAADEGGKPQTEEHLAICTLPGIERGLTVLTKADAVSEERLLETTRAVKSYVRDTFLAGGPVIAVSAHSGTVIAVVMSAITSNMVNRVGESTCAFPTMFSTISSTVETRF